MTDRHRMQAGDKYCCHSCGCEIGTIVERGDRLAVELPGGLIVVSVGGWCLKCGTKIFYTACENKKVPYMGA